MRTIHVRAYCSVKGGVGKSTLATVEAAVLARDGLQPLLLDCDLTGTSLADGLDLRAPLVALRPDGRMDLQAPPTQELMTRAETLCARDSRATAQCKPAPPPFLNDVISYQGDDPHRDCRIDALLWRDEVDDGAWYLPSSSIPDDVSQALGFLHGPSQKQWRRRLAWVLVTICEQLPAVTHILIDLPSGLFGFANEVLSVLAYMAQRRPLPEGYPSFRQTGVEWTTSAALVTSPDSSALFATLEQYVALMDQLPTLEPVVNGATEAPARIEDRIRRRFASTGLSAMALEKRLRWFGRQPTLERLFQDGRFVLKPVVAGEMRALMKGRET